MHTRQTIIHVSFAGKLNNICICKKAELKSKRNGTAQNTNKKKLTAHKLFFFFDFVKILLLFDFHNCENCSILAIDCDLS